jgi:hypothetical protein
MRLFVREAIQQLHILTRQENSLKEERAYGFDFFSEFVLLKEKPLFKYIGLKKAPDKKAAKYFNSFIQ